MLFDGDVLSFIVGEAEVAVGADEGVLGLLEVVDGFVNFVDGGLELNPQLVRGARD